MASSYDETKLTKLGHLKSLAEKIQTNFTTKTEFNALSSKVDGLVSTGGEPNVIDKITVNGDASKVKVTDKTADITIPTKLSEFSNDSKYQSDTEVATAIDAKIKAWAELVTSDNETIDTFKELVDWVAEHGTEAGELAGSIEALEALVGEEAVSKQITDALDTALKTEGADKYALASALTEAISDLTTQLGTKVDKDGDKQLSTEDYTTAEKTKLAGLSNYTHPTSKAGAKTSNLYKIATDANGHVTEATEVTSDDIAGLGVEITDTTYTDVKASGASGLMSSADKAKLDGLVVADDEEVTAMLDEVFTV